MNIRFIKSSEKKDILAELEKQFGINEMRYLLIETGKEKIRAFSGSLSKDEIKDLSLDIRIELIGAYFLKKEEDYRLSLDAAQLLAKQISKSIVEINEEQYELWIRGQDLPIKTNRGVVVIKFKQDFIGCGKSNTEKIFNYIPKERRLKTSLPSKYI